MNTRSCSRIAATVSRRFTHFSAFVLSVLCCLATAQAQNIINTVAGGGTLPPFSTSASGNYADLPGPSSVVTDSQGNVYLAVADAQQIYKVDTSGNLSVFAGEGWSVESPTKYDGMPATSGYLNSPTGLGIDSNGDVFIADTNNYIIREVFLNASGVSTMTTIAGTTHYCQIPTSNCGDGNPAKGAELASPVAVTTDAQGNVYIADTNDNRIRVVNMQSSTIVIAGISIGAGDIATVAGNGTPCPSGTDPCGDGGKAKAAELNSPQGVAVDSTGNIFIADSGDRRIRVVNPKGYIAGYAGTGSPCFSGTCGDGGVALSAQLGTPWQIYVDSKDNLYISDSLTQRIREVIAGATPPIVNFAGNADGLPCSGANTPPAAATFCGDAGPATSAYLNHPEGVYGDAFANIYIGDANDLRVRQVKSGNINTYAGGGLSDGPALSGILGANHDVAVDGAGNIYVADTGNNRIRKVANGTISTVAGSGVAGFYGDNGAAVNANLSGPNGLTVDSSGNVYIADSNNLVIRVLNTQGAPIIVAGVTIQPGSIATVAGDGRQCSNPTAQCGDTGVATKAQLGFPWKVSLDSAGNFYIADSAINRIRMVNASGIITTVAGSVAGTGNACTTPTNFAACGDGGPATAAELNDPHSIAIDSSDNIYVADSSDNRIRIFTVGGNINAYAFDGGIGFGTDGQPALSNSYVDPLYVAVDSRANLFVSGSSLYYVIQRIDASANPALLHPVSSVAGWPVSPKYYGFCCDGKFALGAYLNNFGVAVDSSENLYISDGGNNRVREVSSSPTQGLVPTVKVSPFSLTFSAAPIGMQSAPQYFTVTNTGSDDLVMGTPSITGPFNYVSQSPCYGNIVPPDTSCTYGVTFTPTGYGVEKGTATVYDNAFGSPSQSVKLTGSGPDFTITANPDSLTVSPGSQGQSTITLTPEAGFNQLITLSCTDLPAGGTTCAFNNNPVGMNGSTASTSTLTVTVGSGTAPGTYTIYVKGSSVTTHTTPITLTVP